MSNVSEHYLYLLSRVNLGSGLGWYLPHELQRKSGEEPLHYVIPFSDAHKPFNSYWVQTATYLGKGEFSKNLGCFPMDHHEGKFILKHDIAEITFVVKKQSPQYMYLNYLGRFKRKVPDFRLRLVEIILLENETTEVLFNDAKQIIVNPDHLAPS